MHCILTRPCASLKTFWLLLWRTILQMLQNRFYWFSLISNVQMYWKLQKRLAVEVKCEIIMSGIYEKTFFTIKLPKSCFKIKKLSLQVQKRPWQSYPVFLFRDIGYNVGSVCYYQITLTIKLTRANNNLFSSRRLSDRTH